MDRTRLEENWTNIREQMKHDYNITETSYNTWIRDLKLGPVDGNLVTVYVPSLNPMMIDYLTRRYKEPMTAAISEFMDETCDLIFAAPGEEPEQEQKEEAQKKSAQEDLIAQRAEKANLNPKYKFDTFVIGSNNRLAASASQAVAETPGDVYNPLFLYGGAGLGKTHLMHSIGHYILENNPDLKVLYVTSETFTNEVIESIRSGNAASMTKLRDKYRTVDVLLIDDIQFIIGKESTQEEFFHTFNELHAAGKQIVLSSDRPPREMQTLNERFRSRFEMGLIADIQPPDFETRMAILQKNKESQNEEARRRNQPPQDVDDEILEYIATNIRSNIRELEGAYNKIIAYSKLNNVPITLDMAREALKDIIYPEKAAAVTPKMIANTVCEQYDVRYSMVASRKKSAECVEPRQVIMYLCRKYTDATLDSIAKLLGKKDHSTVMHGVDKIKNDIETNSELRENVSQIEKKLGLVSQQENSN
ncbi:MAG: chromosomal replication initiator protein DnaA [Lachnospiraceae bacterium]|jgi:chromosomal replication initiator protein